MFVIGILAAITANAQWKKDSIIKYVSIGQKDISLKYPEDVMSFYTGNQYKCAWINKNENLQQLERLFKKVPELGFREDDYPISFTRSLLDGSFKLQSGTDSLLAEIRITDGAMHFLHDAAYGNSPPVLGYNGLDYKPGCFNIPGLLVNALNENTLHDVLQQLEPASAGYISLKRLLSLLNQRLQNRPVPETRVSSAEVSRNNTLLIARLYQLGIIDIPEFEFSDKELLEKVKAAQQLFNLQNDGQLHPATLDAMNVSLPARIEALKSALNTVRWLHCMSQYPHIIVINIPSASLLVYASDQVIIQSKVIVGKRSTHTPTLASRITDVILYPYWVVPKKISTRELLPLIKHNSSYLEDNNLQVLDLNGLVVNPANINWQKLDAAYFPYELRQSTGCDNSLGIIKFNFNSPYGVYLHDTPMKNLFSANKRYFSHGCIRVEKAIDLAHLLLIDKSAEMDAVIEKGCLLNQSPVFMPVSEKMPVFVLYNTAWFDSLANVQFNGDIYQKLGKAVIK